MERGSLVNDLVEAARGKVSELHFHDRPHPLHRGSDGKPHHGIFTDRRVENTPGEFLGEVLGGLEGATEGADILTINENTGIAGQGMLLRQTDCLKIRDTAHASYSPRSLPIEAKAFQLLQIGTMELPDHSEAVPLPTTPPL
jgi:hypothetical protein